MQDNRWLYELMGGEQIVLRVGLTRHSNRFTANAQALGYWSEEGVYYGYHLIYISQQLGEGFVRVEFLPPDARNFWQPDLERITHSWPAPWRAKTAIACYFEPAAKATKQPIPVATPEVLVQLTTFRSFVDQAAAKADPLSAVSLRIAKKKLAGVVSSNLQGWNRLLGLPTTEAS